MEENGLTSKDMTGNDKRDLEILYAKMAGITTEEIPEALKGDRTKLTEEISKIAANKDVAKSLD
jgi:hypothetical protein